MSDQKPVTTFTDDEGNPSWTRKACGWCLATSAVLAIIAVLLGFLEKQGDTNAMWMSGMFLTAAMGGKVGQKWAEIKKPKQ